MLNHEPNHDALPDRMNQQERTCARCGSSFGYTDAEAAFRAEHRLSTPVTCPECRAKDRAGRNTEIVALYEKAEASTYSATSPAAAAPRAGGRGHVRGQLYATKCDACGAETRVPFVPRGDRPVYCRDCYNARKGR
jgi:CxxC-x17-CxxC domain-containing protein